MTYVAISIILGLLLLALLKTDDDNTPSGA